MADSEKIAEAYVDIRLRDTTKSDLSTIQSSLSRELRQIEASTLKMKLTPQIDLAKQMAAETEKYQQAIGGAERDLTRAGMERHRIAQDITRSMNQQVDSAVRLAQAERAVNRVIMEARAEMMTPAVGPGQKAPMSQGQRQQIMNQLAFAAQDFATVAAMPGMGIGAGLRGAANNLGMVAMAAGPAAGAIAGVALALSPLLIDALQRAGETMSGEERKVRALKDAYDEFTSSINALASAQRAQFSAAQMEGSKGINRAMGDVQNDLKINMQQRKAFEMERSAIGDRLAAGASGAEREKLLEIRAEIDKKLADLVNEAKVLAGRAAGLAEAGTKSGRKEADEMGRKLAADSMSEFARKQEEVNIELRKRLEGIKEMRIPEADRKKLEEAAGDAAENKKKEIRDKEKKRLEADEDRKQKRLEADEDRKQRDIDEEYNKGKRANESYQRKQEQIKRFQFELEMSGVGDTQAFTSRRRRAQDQLEEDIRRNEEMTSQGSDERKRGGTLAVNKFNATMADIAEDQAKAKNRMRIDLERSRDLLRPQGSRRSDLMEIEERRRQRLKDMEKMELSPEEKGKMSRDIDLAATAERRAALKKQEVGGGFSGMVEMFRGIQTQLFKRDSEKIMEKDIQQTAKNTGKTNELLQQNLNKKPAGAILS